MRHKKQLAIGVFLLAVALYVLQALLWTHTVAHARSETDKQNIEGTHPPSEIPGLAATILLVAAGIIASVPQHTSASKSGT